MSHHEKDMILIAGNSGSGKSTLSHLVAAETGYPIVHLDKVLFSRRTTSENGRGSSKAQFFDDANRAIDEALAANGNHPGGVVVDGTYLSLQELTWHQADRIAFVDPPFATIAMRLGRRMVAPSGNNGNIGYTTRELLPGKSNPIYKAWRFHQEKRPLIIEQMAIARRRGAQTLRSARITPSDLLVD